MSRKISAHYVFPVSGPPLKYGIVVCDSSGRITEVIDTTGEPREVAHLEFYDGIITPGFINAHCHLELSHLKGKIPEKCSLPDFVKHIRVKRDEGNQAAAIVDAEREMKENGIVACGDISNSSASFKVKKASDIYFHTFVEIFGIQNSLSETAWQKGLDVLHALHNVYDLKGNLSPHAPYSVSMKLMDRFVEDAMLQSSVWSIHNQENADEDILFDKKQGSLAEFLEMIDPNYSASLSQGKSSVEAMIGYYEKSRQLLLVHNTYTEIKDLPLLRSLGHKLFLVLCPNSNLYIEGKLPSTELLEQEDLAFALGTDSLASNGKLSILEEMKTLQQNFPFLSLEKLITWATWNGARALNCNTQFGTLEVNKSPGINLITGVDLQRLKLTPLSSVKRLI